MQTVVRWTPTDDPFAHPLQMATVLIYLSDVEEGGETVFPLEGRSGLDRLSNIDYRKCNQGLLVRSEDGLALLPHTTSAFILA